MLNLSVYQLFNVLVGPVPHMCGLSAEHIWLQHEKLLLYACLHLHTSYQVRVQFSKRYSLV